MRIFYDNLIDYSTALLSASSQQTNLPVENLVNEFRTRVWRTGSTLTAEYAVFDLGESKDVTSIIILDHDLTFSDSNIKLEGSDDNFSTVAVTHTLAYAADIIAATFTQDTYRYWRLSFTKSAANQTRQIGRVFLGEFYQTEDEPDFDGYASVQNDNSKKFKSLSGQTYVDTQQQYGSFDLTVSTTTQAMVDGMRTFFDYVGQNKSFFIQVATASPFDKYWYVKLSSPFGQKIMGVNFWDLDTLSFEEQL